MTILTALAAISVAAVWLLFVALALFLRRIAMTLEDIGGPATAFYRSSNLLAKVRLGVRAIETQTSALAPEVTRLNGGLSAVRDGLAAIDSHLAGTIAAALRQDGPR
jgi:hypothetical protein